MCRRRLDGQTSGQGTVQVLVLSANPIIRPSELNLTASKNRTFSDSNPEMKIVLKWATVG